MVSSTPITVKIHEFEPSGRMLYTVVGREDEYWMDPDARYCSCPGYYFGGRNSCYHLESDLITYEITEFNDSEFNGFVAGLIEHMMSPKTSRSRSEKPIRDYA